MISADSALIGWDSKRKHWIVSIHVGEEVIRRPADKLVSHSAADDLLRAKAVETASDDGYEVHPEKVAITR